MWWTIKQRDSSYYDCRVIFLFIVCYGIVIVLVIAMWIYFILCKLGTINLSHLSIKLI